MKNLTVDGITFNTAKEAKAAEKELAAIERIRERMDVSNPAYAKVLRAKLMEKEMLHTKVGEKFLAELDGYANPQSAEVKAEETATEPIAEPVAEPIAEPVVVAEPEPIAMEAAAVEEGSLVLDIDMEEAVEENAPEINIFAEEAVPEEPQQENIFAGEITLDLSGEEPMEIPEVVTEPVDIDIFEQVEEPVKEEAVSVDVPEEENVFEKFTEEQYLRDSDLLEEAKIIKKEMHQEDLREVFANDEETEKKGFGLHGVLACSIILNVLLIAAIALMICVFSNSENRNILNYERILNQTVATPTDADAE